MAKNVISCADGTWNNAHEDENGDHCADPLRMEGGNVLPEPGESAGPCRPENLP